MTRRRRGALLLPGGRSWHDLKLRVGYANPDFRLSDLKEFQDRVLEHAGRRGDNCRGPGAIPSRSAPLSCPGPMTSPNIPIMPQYDRLGE
jgi:hypothetical protein